jgi:general secretion pathway protein M
VKLRSMTPMENRILALLLLLLVVAVAVFGVHITLERLHRHFDDTIADRLDHVARYERIAAMHKDFAARIAEVKARDAGKFFLKNSGPALAASEIQQFAQAVVDANGLRLESMQISPHKDEGGYRRIVVSLNVQGTTQALQKALYTLESAKPYLFVDNLTLRGTFQGRRGFIPTPGVEPLMQAQFELAGYTVAGVKK